MHKDLKLKINQNLDNDELFANTLVEILVSGRLTRDQRLRVYRAVERIVDTKPSMLKMAGMTQEASDFLENHQLEFLEALQTDASLKGWFRAPDVKHHAARIYDDKDFSARSTGLVLKALSSEGYLAWRGSAASNLYKFYKE